jgi:L-fuconolactonase
MPTQPADVNARKSYDDNLRELSKRPGVYVKGSEILRRVDGRVSLDVMQYKGELDKLWDLFGEDRIFFGSDWPNSDALATYDGTFGVAKEYIQTRSEAARQKYFWKNSIAVYRWRARNHGQASLLKG